MCWQEVLFMRVLTSIAYALDYRKLLNMLGAMFFS